MSRPDVVSQKEWKAAHRAILAKEKEATRGRDALAAERRRLPMVRIDKEYAFEGPAGKASLADLFEGRPQLLLYHFMFAPTVEGWPDAGCPGCSLVADQVGHLAHFHARDTSFALVSPAPQDEIAPFKARMGWEVPWYSTAGPDFQATCGTDDGGFALQVLLRDGDRVFLTYETRGRGVEALGSVWTFLDLTPLGRQEDWEDTPPGRPQGPRDQWWDYHDAYGAEVAA